MTKVFCCCIPVRFGVFVMSTLSLLGSGALAAILWFVIFGGKSSATSDIPPPNGSTRIGFIVFAGVSSLIALISLFGLLGAILAKQSLVRLYSTLLWIALLLNIAAGAWYIYAVIKHIDTAAQICKGLNEASDCLNGKTQKAGFIAGFVIDFLLQLYGCIIVSRYVSQLKEERVWSQPAPPQTSSQVPLLNTAYSGGPSYPYGKVENSFGGHNV